MRDRPASILAENSREEQLVRMVEIDCMLDTLLRNAESGKNILGAFKFTSDKPLRTNLGLVWFWSALAICAIILQGHFFLIEQNR